MPKPDYSASFNKAAEIIRGVVLRDCARQDVQPPKSDGAKPDGPIDGNAHLLQMPEKGPDAVLDILDKVVKSIKDGDDLTGTYEKIAKLIHNQESRSELLDNLLLVHDYERMTRYVRARDVLERFFLNCIERNAITPSEAIAFFKIVQVESDNLSARIKGGATSVTDIMALLNKVDYTVQLGQKEIEKKFKNTSPQGREIIRRLAHKLLKVSGNKAQKVEGA